MESGGSGVREDKGRKREKMLFRKRDRSERTVEERRVGGACRRCITKTLYSEHEAC